MTHGSPPYDGAPAVVVGNGPVGQSTALLLARWGIPVVLLDGRATREPIGSKAICQQRDVLDIWESVGAGRAIAEAGVTWSRSVTTYHGEPLFQQDFGDRGRSSFPPFVNLPQSLTESILDDRIGADPLIDVRWSHRVTGLDQHDDIVELSVDTPDGPVALSAPLVVACAGVRGEPVRDMLGVGFPGEVFDDQFLICDIRADIPGWENERRFYFDPPWNPGRQVLIHPCPDSTFRIDWQVPADFDFAHEKQSGGLDERIRTVVGDVEYELVWSSVYRFQARVVERMRVGRVLLAGDCAHVMAPFGGRGLNSGVSDAENAAWKAAFFLRGWAHERLLDSYDAERRAAAAENLDVTSRTMKFLVPRTEAERAERHEVLEQSLRDASARTRVDSGRLYEPFWYVDSPLTTPDATRPPAVRPPRGATPAPGVGVLLPDFPLVESDGEHPSRLRSLARLGLLVLAADDEDVASLEGSLAHAVDAPVRVYSMRDLAGDSSLFEMLGARPHEVWIVRPDAAVAAVLPSAEPGEVRRALVRTICRSEDVKAVHASPVSARRG